METIAGRDPAAAVGSPPEQMVVEDGVRRPLARWYHDRSELSRTGNVARGPALDWSTRPSAFETYPADAIVELGARLAIDRPTGAVLDESRADATSLRPADVSVRELSTLLHLAQGITEVSGLPGNPFHKRAAASSGALYPTVTHVVVGDVDGIDPGVYHYDPAVAHGHAVDQAPFALWHRLLGGQRPSLAAYVAVTGPTGGAAAPPEGGNVGYPPRDSRAEVEYAMDDFYRSDVAAFRLCSSTASK